MQLQNQTLFDAKEAVEAGLRFHQAGRLDDAQACYLQILQHEPDNADALHLLGMVAFERGDNTRAVELIRDAIAADDSVAVYHGNLGNALGAMGDIEPALASYRHALMLKPDFVNAHYNLANTLWQCGHHDDAARHLREAVRLAPEFAEAHNNLGAVLQEQGKFPEAALAFQSALQLRPDFDTARTNLADLLYERGMALEGDGKTDDAAACFRSAIAVKRDHGPAYSHLGALLLGAGDLDEAVDNLRHAAALQPECTECQYNLGNALKNQGNDAHAVDAYRKALALDNDFIDAWYNLGNLHKEQGRLDDAVACYQEVLGRQDTHFGACNNMGVALHGLGRFEEAATCFEKAIALQPGEYEAHNNLGMAIQAAGDPASAYPHYRNAMALQPQRAVAYWNHALASLLHGDFTQGWAYYERRWEVPGPMQEARRYFTRPQWQGEELDGRTVLLHAEQGLGDTLQFIRYAPLVAARGGRVVVESQPGLVGLLAGIDGIDQVVARGERLPEFDLHCPLMSLPLAMGTTLDNIPANVPYLGADDATQRRWQTRLGEKDGLRVGLVWAGNPRKNHGASNLIDRRRSCRLTDFSPLFDVEGVCLYSLQKDEAAAQINEVGDVELKDLSAELVDFTETAAAIANLDLVISVDTAVAHLAGALGKPVWLLSRFDGCWRWLQHRDDSPWYPSMRLFRQQQPGDWAGVMERVAEALRERLQA